MAARLRAKAKGRHKGRAKELDEFRYRDRGWQGAGGDTVSRLKDSKATLSSSRSNSNSRAKELGAVRVKFKVSCRVKDYKVNRSRQDKDTGKGPCVVSSSRRRVKTRGVVKYKGKVRVRVRFCRGKRCRGSRPKGKEVDAVTRRVCRGKEDPGAGSNRGLRRLWLCLGTRWGRHVRLLRCTGEADSRGRLCRYMCVCV